MAIRVQRHLPPRPRALQALTVPIDGLLTPLAHGIAAGRGSGEQAYYVICLAPPGPSLMVRTHPWSEAELLECVLRPAALVLEQMQARGVTHRGIRLDNVFQQRPGQPVVLGVGVGRAAGDGASPRCSSRPIPRCACLRAGRRQHCRRCLFAWRAVALPGAWPAPLAQLDDAAIIRRKLEWGRYAALAGDGTSAAGHRRSGARHARRGSRTSADSDAAAGPGERARPAGRCTAAAAGTAGDALAADRDLGCTFAGARHGQGARSRALHALRSGTVEPVAAAWVWVTRLLAARLEELVRHRNLDAQPDDANGDAALVMRAIALLDPLAPLCWRGFVLWPDGLGAALAAARAPIRTWSCGWRNSSRTRSGRHWAALRAERCDFAVLRVEARQQHAWLQHAVPAAAWHG